MEKSSTIEISRAGKDVDIESQHVASRPSPNVSQAVGTSGLLNLSAVMASNDSLAIFRRFGDLNVLNILCLQAELMNLRVELCGLISAQLKPDSTFDNDPFKNENPIDFKPFINDIQSSERDTLKRIRAKLKEYNSAILEAQRMKIMLSPDPSILSVFRDWLGSQSRCDESGATPWDRAYSNDLLLLSGGAVMQNSMIHELLYRMQELLITILKPFWPQRSSDEDCPSVHLSDAVRDSEAEVNQQIGFANRLIMALFGGVALIIPVLIMAFHPTRNTCLITSIVATLLFALILSFEARDSTGKDVLTATAAYAAVLVVFLGTSLGGLPRENGGSGNS